MHAALSALQHLSGLTAGLLDCSQHAGAIDTYLSEFVHSSVKVSSYCSLNSRFCQQKKASRPISRYKKKCSRLICLGASRNRRQWLVWLRNAARPGVHTCLRACDKSSLTARFLCEGYGATRRHRKRMRYIEGHAHGLCHRPRRLCPPAAPARLRGGTAREWRETRGGLLAEARRAACRALQCTTPQHATG